MPWTEKEYAWLDRRGYERKFPWSNDVWEREDSTFSRSLFKGVQGFVLRMVSHEQAWGSTPEEATRVVAAIMHSEAEEKMVQARGLLLMAAPFEAELLESQGETE